MIQLIQLVVEFRHWSTVQSDEQSIEVGKKVTGSKLDIDHVILSAKF